MTHRAVAKEAGTTHGSARYYFGTPRPAPRRGPAPAGRASDRRGTEPPVPTPDATPHAHDARLAHYLAGAVDDDRGAWGDAQRRTFAVEPAAAGADDPEGDAAHLLTLLNGLILDQLAAI
ncbi:hypothetical protein [Streptomyces sp. CB01580]|uniref:hypothetical protein n=1 Tax=Streptomyces sp. CB01580 TaxID=1703933 RepID=UPI00116106E8|nr:hypothetical protein [Streptomyces sp. CB01580]